MGALSRTDGVAGYTIGGGRALMRRARPSHTVSASDGKSDLAGDGDVT